MKYYIVIFLMLLEVGLIWVVKHQTLADTPLAKGLVITQLKITGDEFIVLRNNSGSELQLSNFWLQYFNNYVLAAGVSSTSFQLPDAKLKAGSELMLSAGLAPTCGPVVVDKLPFALKDTAGLLQIVAIGQDGAIIGYQPHDQISWSNAKTNNSADLKLPSTQDAGQLWFKNSEQAQWQAGKVDYNTSCQKVEHSSSGSGNIATTPQLNSGGGSPPYVVLGTASGSASLIAATNNGLTIPQLSEILPNPAPPQTDENDEFIELYNPNAKEFDLSNFILQTGTTTTHDYVFPRNTKIGPNEFKIFTRADTKLTLSNTEGQVKLLDPTGKVLVESQVYQSAKDGQAWVYAEDKWQWTTSLTPASTNKIAAPQQTSKKTSGLSGSGGSSIIAGNSSESPVAQDKKPSIHPIILAGVGLAALIYAGYEYRNDMGNFIYRFRRNRTSGGISG